MTENKFRVGSLNYLIVKADKVDDILYILYDDFEHFINIIVKPNYNIDEIVEFQNRYIPITISTKIIVEENLH